MKPVYCNRATLPAITRRNALSLALGSLAASSALPLVGCGSSSTQSPSAGSEGASSSQAVGAATRVGIIGAMDIEVTQLCEQLTDEEVSQKAGLEFHAGKLASVEVVVVRSGIGKVNAALCTQALIDLYAPAFIVNTGIGGSLDSGITIGDIVVSSDLVQHDVDVTDLGYQLGEIPGRDSLDFPADERCVSAALDAARDLGFKATSGRIVSGDQFISSEDAKKRLTSSFSGLCCEMEGAAIAQVATANAIPFVVIRTISDNGDSTEYADFGEYAATRSAQLTERMVAILSE